jgi:hypothetical protein
MLNMKNNNLNIHITKTMKNLMRLLRNFMMNSNISTKNKEDTSNNIMNK